MTNQHFKIDFLQDGATRMTCEEAGCPNFENGWYMPIDVTSDLGAQQARYIENESGRRFVKVPGPEFDRYVEGVTFPASIVVFAFPPGQRYCFEEHSDREVVFAHETRGVRRVHVNPLEWNEHFNEEAYKVQRIRERG